MTQTHRLSSKVFSIFLTLAMLLGMLPMYVTATDYPTITAGEEVTVTLDGVDFIEMIYKFVPEKTAEYVFYSFDKDHDTFGHIYDENMNEIAHDDDSGDDTNFKIYYNFTEGTAYYLKGRFFTTTNGGSFKMAVAEPVPATEVVLDMSDPLNVYEGDSWGFEYRLLPLNHAPEDVTFSSDNEDTIVINDNSMRVFGTGTATVTATTESGLTDSITVNAAAAEVITIDTEYTVDYVSDLDYFFARYKFIPENDGIYGFYSYNNNDENVDMFCYDIEDNIYFYGDSENDGNWRTEMELKAGKAYYFTAESGNAFNVKLEALVPATGMHFGSESYSGAYGSSLVLDLVFEPSNAITENVTFTSSDNDILSFDDDGIAYLHNIGNVTVTAESENGLKATCTVLVTDYPHLSLEKPATVYNGPSNDYSTFFKFTPDVSGTYKFFSVGSYDTHGYIFDTDMNPIAENDDSGNYNFGLTAELEAGVTYILRARAYGNWSSGSYTVQIDMVDGNGNTIHDIENYTYTDNDHSGYCSNCEQSITQAHSIDSEGMCICGHKHEHVFEYTYTKENHEAYCDICGGSFSEEHSFDENGNCACGFIYHECVYEWYGFYYSDIETYHETRCVFCLETLLLDHVFDESNTCTDCGYTVHEHSTDDYRYYTDGHYGYCDTCGVEISEEHSFDEDGNCVCGYYLHTHSDDNFEIYMTYHIGICDLCGVTLNESHIVDDSGNCFCGYADHEHNYTEYEKDDNIYHYEICADCGVKNIIEHFYDENGACICGDTLAGELMIGGVVLGDGQYLDSDGNVSDTEPAEWSAYFKDGVLTLKDIRVEAEGEGVYGIYIDNDLEIVLNGNAVLSATNEDCIHIASGDLTIGGEGTLNVIAYGDYDGIDAASNGDVTINSGTIIINAVDHGIEAEEKLTVNGGTVIVIAGDDGFDTEDTAINDGEIYIHAEDHGIDADDIITVNSGTINITTNDDDGFEAGDYITVNGGNITINANGYGLCNSNGMYDDCVININGGTLDITSGKGAMLSYVDINIDPVMGEYELIDIGETYSENDGETYDHAYLLGQDGEILTSVYMSETESSDTEKTIRYDWITMDKDRYDYSGNKVTPSVTVGDPETGKLLVENTDYTVTMSSNDATDIGVYYVKIEGIGEYSGVVYKPFSIINASIYVGGVHMESGDYLASGADTVTDTKPEGGYAYYKDGVLELNGYSYEGSGYMYDDFGYNALIYSDYDLEIDLKGVSELIGTAKENDAITAYGDLTIGGNGNLVIESQYGIYSNSGNVTVNGGNISISSKEDAIGVFSGELNITGGTIVASSKTNCIYAESLYISGGSVDLTIDNSVGNGDRTAIYSIIDITISGGNISVDSPDIGMSCNYDITISGGTVDIDAMCGISSSGNVRFEDGAVSITSEKEAVKSYGTDGIILSENIEVISPENANIKNVNGTSYIFGGDGKLATNVIIQPKFDAEAAAAEIDALIAAIGEVTLDSEDAIVAARAAVDAASEDVLAYVEGIDALETAEAELELLKRAADRDFIFDVIDGVIAPVVPQNVVAIGSFTSIDISWDAVDGATKYWIVVDGVVVAVTTDTSYTLTDYDPADYEIAVRVARNAPYGTSYVAGTSDAVVATVTGYAAAIEFSVDGDNFTASWSFADESVIEKAWVVVTTEDGTTFVFRVDDAYSMSYAKAYKFGGQDITVAVRTLVDGIVYHYDA